MVPAPEPHPDRRRMQLEHLDRVLGQWGKTRIYHEDVRELGITKDWLSLVYGTRWQTWEQEYPPKRWVVIGA